MGKKIAHYFEYGRHWVESQIGLGDYLLKFLNLIKDFNLNELCQKNNSSIVVTNGWYLTNSFHFSKMGVLLSFDQYSKLFVNLLCTYFVFRFVIVLSAKK